MRTVFLAFAAALAIAARGVEIGYDGADPAAKFAAQDLRKILNGVSGRIILKEDATLASQAWRLKTMSDGSLVIAGRDGMGIAYGVYSFLEKHAGCRWYAPDTTLIPDRTGWTLPIVNEAGRPAIQCREMYVGADGMDSTWRLRNKETMRAAHGCNMAVGSPGDCHTFAAYAEAVKSAGLKTEGGAFCLTDPRVRHVVAERMKGYIRSDRATRKGAKPYELPSVYELSQNDGGSCFPCKCINCQALYRQAGSWSGLNLAFANAVAAEVGREFPDVTVRTFAYAYTERPPTNGIVAADNVAIRYCRSFLFQPLTDETDNGRILRDWDAHVKGKHVWSYWRPFSGPLFPAVKPRADIGREMRFCRDRRVCGYMAENEDPLSRSFAMMQHWLFLKLAENPDLDVAALGNEFLRAYYGAAAKPIGEYLAYLERREKENFAKLDRAFLRGLDSGHLAMYVQRAYLDRAFFETATRLLDEAARLAAGDARAALHVAHERLVVDRTLLEMASALDKSGLKVDSAAIARRIGETLPALLKGWKLPSAELKRRLARVRTEVEIAAKVPAPTPDDLKYSEYIEWPCDRLGTSGTLVQDADSVYGWALTFPKASHRIPYLAGVYDEFTKKINEMKLEDWAIPKDGKFHLYRLGEMDLVCESRVYYDWTWRYATWLPSFGLQSDRRDIWVSVKLTGPTYVKGSNEPDGLFVERVILAKPLPFQTPTESRIPCSGEYSPHLQGVATDGKNLYWSHTVELVKTDARGKKLVSSGPVAKHHGDLCWKDGIVYVAVNLVTRKGENKVKNWVYAYKDSNLSLVNKWPIPEVVHGAGGITAKDDRFFVIGGAPKDNVSQTVYEYTADFEFVAKHELKTGWLNLGIQTVDFQDGRFVFGSYGSRKDGPGRGRSTFVTPPDLSSVEFVSGPPVSEGIVRLKDKTWRARIHCLNQSEDYSRRVYWSWLEPADWLNAGK